MALSKELREQAVRLHKEGTSLTRIAAIVRADRSTIVRLLERYRRAGSVAPGKHTGRPRILRPRDERELFRIVRKDPTTRPSTMQNALYRTGHPRISTQTVRRTLQREGLEAHKPRRKPRLKPEQRWARLEWALEYAKKPPKFWETVIFSDESPFHVHEAMRGQWVWRFPQEELEPRFVQQTVKFGGGSVQVWGCVTAQGVGWPCALPEGLNGPTYVGILEKELQYTIDYYFKGFRGVVFQQDGAGVHRANVVNDFLAKQRYTLLPWPAHSPDLSPIENLWANVKRRLMERKQEIHKKDLWNVIQEEWEATPKEYCKTLFASMPARLQAVIQAKGGHTKY